MSFQTTIAKDTRAVGVGLHSGKLVTMTIKPAPPQTGIVFVRTDLGGRSIKASIENVDFERLQLATVLKQDDAIVQTTEHILSALYSLGVDNVFVEVDGPELPIMDGSAAPFVYLIEEAGVKRQAAPRKLLRVVKPFHFEHQGKTISVYPEKDFRISYEIEFDHPLIRHQKKTVTVNRDHYENEISRARTFGFLKDVNYLKSLGLIQGGSVENAVVLDGDRILNESLRQHDEFVSHKILDFIGDLSVCGFRLRGHFVASKAGHEAHAHFLRALLKQADCYRIESTETVGKPNFAPFPLRPHGLVRAAV